MNASELAGQPDYSTNEEPEVFVAPNEAAALGNTFKGLIGGARWAPPLPNSSVPLSMEGEGVHRH